MPEALSLVVVGGGRMGDALVTGLLQTGWAEPGRIAVVESDPARRGVVAKSHQGLNVAATVSDALAGVAAGDLRPEAGAVVAVKPGDVAGVCGDLVAAGVTRVVSIAAGVTLASLEEWLGSGVAVIRAMPNTPALVGAGMSAIAAGSRAGPADLDWAHGILAAVGAVVELPETALDAVTGLSGSGPAYVFLLAEALIDAGVLVGLTRPVAHQLAVQTLLGAARLLDQTGDEPATLRAAVTSPGGTTAAGLRALEAAGVRNAILDAVAAATERSRQLGEG